MDNDTDTTQQQNSDVKVWPPAPDVGVQSVSVVSSKKLITRYVGLDATLGAGMGFVLPPLIALVSTSLDTSLYPSNMFVITYLASIFSCGCLCIGLRKQYKTFSTALLIGLILSLIAVVGFIVLADFPGGPD